MTIEINNPKLIDGLENHQGRQVFQLVEDLEVKMTDNAGNIIGNFIVPEGYRTDFASVPLALWWIMPPAGQHSRAAILHDYLYDTPGICSRWFADALFREIMRELEVAKWRRVAAFYAVRFFGGIWWKDLPKSEDE